MNLIEQQNVLKGLTDESLQAELTQPSGSAPPFLIATEVSRRKAARERYEGAKAKAPATTVMEDLMGARLPQQAAPGGFAGAVPAMPTGLEAALPDIGVPSTTEPVQAFAEGGLVRALDYDTIGQRYAETLDGLGDRRDRARALALIEAGGAIMGGGSSNTLTNLGKGLTAGATSYGTGLSQIDQDEQRTLAAALQLESAQQGDELQRLQFDWTRNRDTQDFALRREALDKEDVPASIREAQTYDAMTPEERTTYDKLNPAPAATLRDPLAESFNEIYQQVEKAYPPLASMDTIGKTPAEVDALIAERAQRVALQAYNRIRATLGEEAAARYARQAGISDGEVLTSTPAAMPASTSPGGAVSYTEYFTD